MRAVVDSRALSQLPRLGLSVRTRLCACRARGHSVLLDLFRQKIGPRHGTLELDVRIYCTPNGLLLGYIFMKLFPCRVQPMHP
jgi:hypothetical protein